MDKLLWIAVILVGLWVVGYLVFRIAALLVHLLLIVGVIMLIWWAARRLGLTDARPRPGAGP